MGAFTTGFIFVAFCFEIFMSVYEVTYSISRFALVWAGVLCGSVLVGWTVFCGLLLIAGIPSESPYNHHHHNE